MKQALFLDDYKLKLETKKLASGKFQVKFKATSIETADLYGYVLVNAKDTLKEVVTTIKNRLYLHEEADDYYHSHLYAVGKEAPMDSGFMIFQD